MALALLEVFRERERGNRKIACYEVTFDNSYPVGGYVIAATDVGMDVRIDAVTVQDENTFYALKLDSSAKKIKAGTDGSSGGELANGSSVLNQLKALLFVFGS